MTTITIDNVIPMLKKVVAGNENKVYTRDWDGSYKYAHRDAPGCIVGHVFHNELPELYEEIHAVENPDDKAGHSLGSLGMWGANVDYLPGLWNDYKSQVSDEATAVLTAAQSAQDSGDSWANALESARLVRESILDGTYGGDFG